MWFSNPFSAFLSNTLRSILQLQCNAVRECALSQRPLQVVHETTIGHVVFLLLLLHSQLRKCVNDDTKHDVQQNLQETTPDVNGPAARCTLPVDNNTVSRTMLNLHTPQQVSALSQAGSLLVWVRTCDHTPIVWPSLGLLRRRWRSCICDTGNVSPHKTPLSR